MNELKERMLGKTMNEYGCDTKVYLKSEADRVIARHKYKRCLTMYHYCAIKALYELDLKGNDVEWKWYSKWMHKWFKLAKKFKEATCWKTNVMYREP